MPAAVTRYSVFIASPGDVAAERAAALAVIQRWNNLHSQTSGIVLEPLLWESNSVPDWDTAPQDRINTDLLARADLVVAILWSRAGTPTKTHASGTLEEIDRFTQRKMVYFCQRERRNRPGTDDAAQAAQVDAFRAEHEGKSFFREFKEVADFRDLLFDNLVQWSNELSTLRAPAELLPYDVYKGDPTLLAEWARSEHDGTVLIYNAELSSFQDAASFQRVWGPARRAEAGAEGDPAAAAVQDAAAARAARAVSGSGSAPSTASTSARCRSAACMPAMRRATSASRCS